MFVHFLFPKQLSRDIELLNCCFFGVLFSLLLSLWIYKWFLKLFVSIKFYDLLHEIQKNWYKLFQYLRSIFIGMFGEGIWSKIVGRTLFGFSREGNSSTLRDILPPSIELLWERALRGFWACCSAADNLLLSLVMWIFCFSTLCIAYLYLFFISSSSLTIYSALPMGGSYSCSISIILCSASNNFFYFSI